MALWIAHLGHAGRDRVAQTLPAVTPGARRFIGHSVNVMILKQLMLWSFVAIPVLSGVRLASILAVGHLLGHPAVASVKSDENPPAAGFLATDPRP